jgi:hypothetical protein
MTTEHTPDALVPLVWQNSFEAVRRRWDAFQRAFVIEYRYLDKGCFCPFGAGPDWDAWRHVVACSDAAFSLQLYRDAVGRREEFWSAFELAKSQAFAHGLQSYDKFCADRKMLNACPIPLVQQDWYTQRITGDMKWLARTARNPGVAMQDALGRLLMDGR